MNGDALPVIPLTITVSLCLVFTFVVFFVREHLHRFRNAERESLLPLADETPRLASPVQPAPAKRPHHHSHDHDGCGCRTGRTIPCPGCLKRDPVRTPSDHRHAPTVRA